MIDNKVYIYLINQYGIQPAHGEYMFKFELVRKSNIKPLVAVLGVALTSITAFPSTLVKSTTYNGHTYDLYDSQNISWQNAKTEAAADGGYLAAFTDSAETFAVYGAFIGTGFFVSNIGQQNQAWLGGYTTDANFSTSNPTRLGVAFWRVLDRI